MKDNDVLQLEEVGLSRAQAVVYLTILELGTTKVGPVINRSGLQSSVVHNAINQLIEEGLINYNLYGKIRHYQTSSPEVLLHVLDQQKKQIEKRRETISEMLPRLKLTAEDAKNPPEVKLYRGRKGFEIAYLEAYTNLSQGDAACFLALPPEYQEDEELHHVFKKLSDALPKGCIIRGIGPRKLRATWEEFYGEDEVFELRYHDDELPWGLEVYPDSIMISLWGDEPLSIKVTNSAIVHRTQKYFEDLWEQAEP